MQKILYLIIFLLLNLFLMLGCFREEQNEYEILSIENNPRNTAISEYPDIDDKNILIEGVNEITLKRNAEKFYGLFWLKNKGIYKFTSKDTKEKVNEIIRHTQNDLDIKIFSDKIARITRTTTGFSSDDLVRVQDVWHLSEKKWKPFLNHANHFYKSELLYLNDDNFIDLIIEGGCCDSLTYSIFLGDSKNNFEHIQDITIIGIPKIESIGKCDYRIKVKHFQDYHFYTKSAYFDCEKNRFVNY